jgi:hypothetical protein
MPYTSDPNTSKYCKKHFLIMKKSREGRKKERRKEGKK